MLLINVLYCQLLVHHVELLSSTADESYARFQKIKTNCAKTAVIRVHSNWFFFCRRFLSEKRGSLRLSTDDIKSLQNVHSRSGGDIRQVIILAFIYNEKDHNQAERRPRRIGQLNETIAQIFYCLDVEIEKSSEQIRPDGANCRKWFKIYWSRFRAYWSCWCHILCADESKVSYDKSQFRGGHRDNWWKQPAIFFVIPIFFSFGEIPAFFFVISIFSVKYPLFFCQNIVFCRIPVAGLHHVRFWGAQASRPPFWPEMKSQKRTIDSSSKKNIPRALSKNGSAYAGPGIKFYWN